MTADDSADQAVTWSIHRGRIHLRQHARDAAPVVVQALLEEVRDVHAAGLVHLGEGNDYVPVVLVPDLLHALDDLGPALLPVHVEGVDLFSGPQGGSLRLGAWSHKYPLRWQSHPGQGRGAMRALKSAAPIIRCCITGGVSGRSTNLRSLGALISANHCAMTQSSVSDSG